MAVDFCARREKIAVNRPPLEWGQLRELRLIYGDTEVIGSMAFINGSKGIPISRRESLEITAAPLN